MNTNCNQDMASHINRWIYIYDLLETNLILGKGSKFSPFIESIKSSRNSYYLYDGFCSM